MFKLQCIAYKYKLEHNGNMMSDDYLRMPVELPEQESQPATSQQAPSQMEPIEPPKQKRSKKKWLLFILPLLLVGIGFGVWEILHKNTASETPVVSSQSQAEVTPEPTVTKDLADAPTTQKYDNGFLGVTLTYPSTWTATEGENKTSVRFESPEFSYTSIAKGKVTGNFRIYIRKGSTDMDRKYIGRGYAIEPSQKLVYNKPTLGQRTDTNLSLFGLDEPNNFAYFLIAGNFELKKGDTLGPDYGKEAETYIIAGGFSDKSLTDNLGTNPVATDYIKTSNAYKQAIEVLKSLQLQ
jgi:hypothetical protein